MTTFTAQKRSHEILSAEEYLRRRQKDPKSVEGARILVSKFGSEEFGGFAIKRSVPRYEVLPDSDNPK